MSYLHEYILYSSVFIPLWQGRDLNLLGLNLKKGDTLFWIGLYCTFRGNLWAQVLSLKSLAVIIHRILDLISFFTSGLWFASFSFAGFWKCRSHWNYTSFTEQCRQRKIRSILSHSNIQILAMPGSRNICFSIAR